MTTSITIHDVFGALVLLVVLLNAALVILFLPLYVILQLERNNWRYSIRTLLAAMLVISFFFGFVYWITH
jgi:hypothetical protein